MYLQYILKKKIILKLILFLINCNLIDFIYKNDNIMTCIMPYKKSIQAQKKTNCNGSNGGNIGFGISGIEKSMS